MIQAFVQRELNRGPRRASAMLLAVFLNLALVPCSMALEIEEDRHDCCPDEVKIERVDCCDLDDASVDSRSGTQEVDATPDFEPILIGAPVEPRASSGGPFLARGDPPVPRAPTIAIHKRNCVYLK